MADDLIATTSAILGTGDGVRNVPSLVDQAGGDGAEEPAVVASLFSQLKTDPGPVGLNSVLKELATLEQLTLVSLPVFPIAVALDILDPASDKGGHVQAVR